MLVRIVRMEFDPDKVEEFIDLFSRHKQLIRAFPGCLALELHRDQHNDQVFYTLSHWQSSDDLDRYRSSSLFRSVWKSTKALFREKALAYSLLPIENVNLRE